LYCVASTACSDFHTLACDFLGRGTAFAINLDFCDLKTVSATVILCYGRVILKFLEYAKVLAFSIDSTKVISASYDCYNDYSPARVLLYTAQL